MKSHPSRLLLAATLLLLALTAVWQRFVPTVARAPGAAFVTRTADGRPALRAPRALPPAVRSIAAAEASALAAAPGNAFARFDDWMARFLVASAADRLHLLDEGRALAAERRVLMAQLIRTDPRAALAAAVPMVARQQMPPDLLALLEDRVAGRGDLLMLGTTPAPGQPAREATFRIAAVAGGEYRAHVFGRRDQAGSVVKTSLNGIALEGHLAVAESPLRVLEPGEVAGGRLLDAVCEVSGKASVAAADTPFNLAAGVEAATAVEYDGAIHLVCGARHLAATERLLVGREEKNVAAGPVLGRPDYTWTHGAKRLLLIRVDFSDRPGPPANPNQTITDDFAASIVAGVQSFYASASFGQTSIAFAPPVGGDSPDVSPVLRMPQPAAYYAGNGTERAWQLHVDARAAAQAAGLDVAAYDRVGVVFSWLDFWWSGLGEIAGRNFWVNGSFGFHVVAHELGHTYGMMHSNAWIVSDGNPVSPTGTSREYGDEFDIMGGGSDPSRDFSQWNKYIVQWLPDAAVLAPTLSGTYRIYRFDHAAANLGLPRALKVRRNEQQDYWIGFRRGAQNSNLQNGAYVLWGYHSNQQSNLLDMTPGTAGNFYDAALPIGATFTDAAAAVSFTVVGRGGSGADEWLDVRVGFLPSVHWSQTGEYNFGEQDGQGELRVLRDGDPGMTVTVNYAMTDGTARSPADYTAQTGTLTWTPGDTGAKYISIPLQSDTLREGGERFTVTLSNATNAVISGNAAATVAILDGGIADFGFLTDSIYDRVESVLTLADGSLVIAGAFQQIVDDDGIAQNRGGIAKLTPEGDLVPSFAPAGGVSGADSVVHALALQADGKVIVGGSFLTIQGASRLNVARLLPDGTLDTSFAASTNGAVRAILGMPDGRILLGGAFTSVNGVPREYLARLNADGTLDPSFVGPDFDGSDTLWVRSLAVQADGRILAGGTFTFFDNQVYLRSGLCRLLPTGALDSSFIVREGAHQTTSTHVLGDVRAIVVQPDGSILIGGTFSAYNGTPRGGVARLTATGALDLSFRPTTNGTCNALLPLPDGRLVVGGSFSNAGGEFSRSVALFQASGDVDAYFSSVGGFAGELFGLQLTANRRIQLWGANTNFAYSQLRRPVWRAIADVANLAGTVQFTSLAAHAHEGEAIELRLTRTGGTGGDIAVGYGAALINASPTDFEPAGGTVTWANGDGADKVIRLFLTRDTLAEGNEFFSLRLGTPLLGGAALGKNQDVQVMIENSTPPPPPSGWQAADIGAVGAAGSSSESGGTVTMSAAGADIWGTADGFHFRSQTMTGDGAIIARVASLGTGHPWAKVGLMFREDLSPGAREVMAYLTPANHAGLQYRLQPGAESAVATDVWGEVPMWLMLVRSGNSFGAYRSWNGDEWIPMGTINCALPTTAYVGLALTSHAAGTLIGATLSDVDWVGSTPPPGEPPVAPGRLATTGVTATTVTLTWSDNSSDETGFAIERAPGLGGTFAEVGTAAADSRAFTDTGLTANTSYSYRVRAQRGTVYSAYTDPVVVTTGTQPPTGWQGLDIGNVGPGGSETVSDSSITVLAGGVDMWGTSDGFRYVYQAWRGDGEIRARVARLDNTHPWAKAGVMFRETLAADAKNVAYVFSAAAASGLQVRAVTGGETSLASGPWFNPPYWVRLVRSGNTFTASISPDGTTWTEQGTQTVAMNADIYVGVAVSAHTTTAMTTGAFEYVQLPASQPPPPPPPPADWTKIALGGATGNFAAPDVTSISVTGTGADIWGAADDGLFVQRAWSGDGEVVTRVESFTNTHPWAKAGIMFRQTLAANSPNVFLALTPGTGAAFQIRSETGGATTEPQHSWVPGVPAWLKLTRVGDSFTASFSANGTAWTVLGSQTLVMPRDIFLGFGVSSHSATSTAVMFRDISLPSSPPPPPPPGTWTQTPLGSGSGSFTAASTTMNVTATGADLWGQLDDGLFVQRAWTGDGEITVRIDSLTNTHPWAKAGIMFRESLTAGSPNVFVGLTPSVGAVFQARTSAGGATSEPAHSWVPGAPSWLRLKRTGVTFSAAYSTDGTTWIALGTQTLAMPTTLYVGLAASSHATVSTNVAFSNLQLQPAAAGR